MTVIIPTGHYQTAITMTSPNIANGTAVTVLGWSTPESIGSGNLAEAAEDCFNYWVTNMLPRIDEEVALVEVRAVTETLSATFSGVENGTQVFADPPPNVAVLINHRTAVRGPRGRGRTYLYGALSEGIVSSRGVIDGSYVTAIQTAWDGFVEDMVAAALPSNLVVLQGTGPGDVSAPITPPPSVTSSSVASTVASQRRRLRP